MGVVYVHKGFYSAQDASGLSTSFVLIITYCSQGAASYLQYGKGDNWTKRSLLMFNLSFSSQKCLPVHPSQTNVIKETAHVRCFWNKMKEARLTRFGHVQRRDNENIDRRMLRMEMLGRKLSKEEIHG